MNRYLKWTGIALGSLLTLIALLLIVLIGIGGMKVGKTYDIQVAAVSVPTDAASIERGKHFVESMALCQECHGENLEGQALEEEDDPLFGRFAPANLTSGRGGLGGTLSDADYVRAIRHGVNREGKGIPIMPSELYNKIGDDDLGAIIAYLKSLPPVDNDVPRTTLRPLGRIIALVEPSLISAQIIDHTAPRPSTPEPGVTAEYGEYLTFVCTICHGQDYGGGFPPDSDVRAPNLTSSGTLSAWSEDDFINTLRTGVTPGGNELDAELMFWPRFAKMTDDELKAVWLFLQSLPPATPGG